LPPPQLFHITLLNKIDFFQQYRQLYVFREINTDFGASLFMKFTTSGVGKSACLSLSR